jgi:hypothetical protein
MLQLQVVRLSVSQGRETGAEKQGSNLIGPFSSRESQLKYYSISVSRGYATAVPPLSLQYHTPKVVIYFHHFLPPLQYDMATWLRATGPKQQ